MSDKIRLRDLALPVVIGTLSVERSAPQEIIFQVEVECDLAAAGESDDLNDALDYSMLEREIRQMAVASRFFLLEKLAAATAQLCLAHREVSACRIVLEKPAAPRYARSVEVEIYRKKNHVS